MDSTGDELIRGEKDLLALVYDRQIWSRADAVFGRFLKRGRNMRNELGEYLENAEENGQISDPEHDQVLACDLLWGGELRKSKEEFFVAVRVSWTPLMRDIQEAAKAAYTLRSIGLKALGVVAGVKWIARLRREALDLGVVMVDDLRLDRETWEAALALVL